MTSRTWVIGGSESQKQAAGAIVRQAVDGWGDGYVEALVDIRGAEFRVDSAHAWPQISPSYDAGAMLQSSIGRRS